MAIQGKIHSFYFKKGTSEVNVYSSTSGKEYRRATIKSPKGVFDCRVYNETLEIGDTVDLSILQNADGEDVYTNDGNPLFLASKPIERLEADNSKLAALLGAKKPTATVVETVEGSVAGMPF